MKFQLGRLLTTREADQSIRDNGESNFALIRRHQSGDWGDLDASDKQANEDALVHGDRILSRYNLKDGTVIYIITEADRSVTTIMLRSEY